MSLNVKFVNNFNSEIVSRLHQTQHTHSRVKLAHKKTKLFPLYKKFEQMQMSHCQF